MKPFVLYATRKGKPRDREHLLEAQEAGPSRELGAVSQRPKGSSDNYQARFCRVGAFSGMSGDDAL
jgi:hypothetical protein